MRFPLLIFCFFLSTCYLAAQQRVQGRVINYDTGLPLAYAKVRISEEKSSFTDFDGYFEIQKDAENDELLISYPGFFSKSQELSDQQDFYLIQLIPNPEYLTRKASQKNKTARALIKKALKQRPQNDPEKALSGFKHKSYNKFVIDRQVRDINMFTDTSETTIETIITEGRGFLSEKVSRYSHLKPGSPREIIEGIKTAGFDEPVYEISTMNLQPHSLYENEYPILQTRYASPFGPESLKNYTYKILDTLHERERPAYLVYFEPKREKIVAGLEGVLFIDTLSYAVQELKARLKGELQLNLEHDYQYFPEENIWFPKEQKVVVKPGTGEKEISVFGGIIGLGTLQRKESILTRILPFGEVQEDLYLSSTTTNYNIALGEKAVDEIPPANIWVETSTTDKSIDYWKENRQEPFTIRDEITARQVRNIVEERNIERKLEVQNSLSEGHYPVGFFDIALGRLLLYNQFEGIRAGFGGRTNEKFSLRYRLEGYAAYGFRDEAFKYSIDVARLLNPRSATWLNIGYSDEIRELSGFSFLSGPNEFVFFPPRLVNISDNYQEQNIRAGISHRFNPRLETGLTIGHNHISQLTEYRFAPNGREFSSYNIAEAKIGALWRPFSKFLVSPNKHILIEQHFPEITAQISQSFSGLAGGDFDFTKFALRIEHRIERLNLSQTRFILDGRYGTGDLPLTHAFHADPNNQNETEILERFSIAGVTGFETMFFNEFFSDRQLSLQVRHRLRPFSIFAGLEPELVLISRHVVGDFSNRQDHKNISFKTLDEIYSEAGFEINKLFAVFGLSFAYRYGAYHLPTFKENFSFKFTFRPDF